MKKTICCFLAMIFFKIHYAQNLQHYDPVSPNAASLGKFGAFPVNKNLGKANISIPLYTIRSGDIEIPISLSYNASSGIRVNEEASWVGLGWTLNAGGAIVRSVKGQPSHEEIPDLGNLDFTSKNAHYMYNVIKGHADDAPDEFLFNYSGNSGKFLYDQKNKRYVFEDYKPIKVTSTGGFKAVLQNGVKLAFDAIEITDKWQEHQITAQYRTYGSAYFLTNVTSCDNTRKVSFQYSQHTIEKGKVALGQTINYNINSPHGQLIPTLPPPITNISKPIKITEQILKKIEFTNGYILFKSSLDRKDNDSPKLDHIEVYSAYNGVNKLIKKITFTYDYYQRKGGKNFSKEIHEYIRGRYDKSLRLKTVTEYTNQTKPKVYRFDYNQTSLPVRYSAAQDF